MGCPEAWCVQGTAFLPLILMINPLLGQATRFECLQDLKSYLSVTSPSLHLTLQARTLRFYHDTLLYAQPKSLLLKFNSTFSGFVLLKLEMIQQSSFVKQTNKKKAYKVANKGKVNALLMEHNSSKVLCASDFFFGLQIIFLIICVLSWKLRPCLSLCLQLKHVSTVHDTSQLVQLSFIVEPYLLNMLSSIC